MTSLGASNADPLALVLTSMAGGWPGGYPMDPNFTDMSRAAQQGNPQYLNATPNWDYNIFALQSGMQGIQLHDPALQQPALQAFNLAAGGRPLTSQLYGAGGQQQLGARASMGDRSMIERYGGPQPGARGFYGGGSAYGPPQQGPHMPQGARRQTGEINMNKAITKRLASAAHYQRVRLCCCTLLFSAVCDVDAAPRRGL
jgi:hypothetical protein